MSLSKKMAGFSGTEPIQLITPKKESSTPSLPERQAPQQYYNALPGPPEPKQETIPEPAGNRTVPPSAVYQEPEAAYYEIKPTAEELKGAFFLRPFVAVQSPFEFNGLLPIFNTVDSHNFSLDSKVGSAVGIGLGRRLGNVEILLKLGYHNNQFSGNDEVAHDFMVSDAFVEGETELLDLSLNAGLVIPVSEMLSFGLSFGFGYASRMDSAELEIPSLFPSAHLANISSSVFSYNLGLSLDYKYSEVMSASLGYRLMGVSENDPYEQMTLHLFEVGLGANF